MSEEVRFISKHRLFNNFRTVCGLWFWILVAILEPDSDRREALSCIYPELNRSLQMNITPIGKTWKVFRKPFTQVK